MTEQFRVSSHFIASDEKWIKSNVRKSKLPEGIFIASPKDERPCPPFIVLGAHTRQNPINAYNLGARSFVDLNHGQNFFRDLNFVYSGPLTEEELGIKARLGC